MGFNTDINPSSRKNVFRHFVVLVIESIKGKLRERVVEIITMQVQKLYEYEMRALILPYFHTAKLLECGAL